MLLISVDKYPSKKVVVSSGLSVCMSQQKMSFGDAFGVCFRGTKGIFGRKYTQNVH